MRLNTEQRRNVYYLKIVLKASDFIFQRTAGQNSMFTYTIVIDTLLVVMGRKNWWDSETIFLKAFTNEGNFKMTCLFFYGNE